MRQGSFTQAIGAGLGMGISVGTSVGVHSFTRHSRLLKPADFTRVFDQPVVSSDALFRVLARTGEKTRSRLGLAVSRRVDPRASVRNRIKRVIRESFRLGHPIDAGGRSARDYVVLAAPPSARASRAQLAESLSRHWQAIDRKLEEE